MIRNRLNILLAERNLTIKDVNEGTGLSRTTISNMINGISDGLQMKTLDILLNYLEVSPADFFDYAPFIYKFYSKENEYAKMIIEVKSGERLRTYWYDFSYSTEEDFLEEDTRLEKYDLYVSVYTSDYEDPFLKDVYNTLSITLRNVFKNEFIDSILDVASKAVDTGELKSLRGDKIIDKDKEMKTLFRTPVGTFTKTFDPMTELFI